MLHEAMPFPMSDVASNARNVPFLFRPWVRRAGLSIVLVAAAISAIIVFALAAVPGARYGWLGERFVWVYIGTLWLGGMKVWTGTLRPVAETNEETLVLRPLHQLRGRTIRWDDVRGTEQMVGGDRLIVYYDTPRGMRFVALNLNLVKGRRDFLTLVEQRLTAMDFTERVVDRSRYRTRAAGASTQA
ncbi:MAG: hypothetical protein JWO56_92 [Acidobacteria bacterium]|nr:hypothetical protein [Acidobacteriota bacterium]